MFITRVAGTRYASAVARKRSIKVVDVAGWASVAIKKRAVDVGSQYVRFFRQIAGTAYYIVFARLYGGDKSRTVGIYIQGNPVANSDRVSGPQSFQTEISFYFARNVFSVFGTNNNPASGVFNNKSVHFITKVRKNLHRLLNLLGKKAGNSESSEK